MKTRLFFILLQLSVLVGIAQLDSITSAAFTLLQKEVPTFSASSIDGKTISSEYFKNKFTVIVFMSPGCAPCRYELPKLDQWTKQFSKDTFQVLVIYDSDAAHARDFRSAQSKAYRKIKKKFGLDSLAFDCVAECLQPQTRIITRACNTIAPVFKVNAWPSTFFVDKNGRIQNYESGYAMGNTAEFDAYFDVLLKCTVEGRRYVYGKD